MQALENLKARIQLSIKNIMPITIFGNIEQRLIFVNDEETASRFINEPQVEKSTRQTPAPRSNNLWFWVAMMLIGFWIVSYLPSCSTAPAPSPVTTIEHQAALGGAAIPFPSVTPSPMPSEPPLGDWNAATADSPSMSPSELPLPDSPQADAGQTRSTRLFRPLLRRIR